MPSADELRAAFKLFDTDGSGALSVSELAAILSDTQGGKPYSIAEADAEAARLMKKFDKNGDGMLQYDEFVDYFGGRATAKPSADVLKELPAIPLKGRMSSSGMAADEAASLSADISAELDAIMRQGDDAQARAMFDSHDKDGSGTIDAKELRSVLKGIDELKGLDPDQLKEYTGTLLKKLDKDKDASLSWEEFRDFYRKCLASERARASFSGKVGRPRLITSLPTPGLTPRRLAYAGGGEGEGG